MRKNRRDPHDPVHELVWGEPSRFTRASRRSVGYRQPTHLGLEQSIMPRYARRHWSALTSRQETRRVRKHQARIGRLLRPFGLEFA